MRWAEHSDLPDSTDVAALLGQAGLAPSVIRQVLDSEPLTDSHLRTLAQNVVTVTDQDFRGIASLSNPSADERVLSVLRAMAEFGVARGATLKDVLARESPVVMTPDWLLDASEEIREAVVASGLPVAQSDEASGLASTRHLRMGTTLMDGLAAHPVFAMESVEAVATFGENSLSSFIVHNEPERDGWSITGDPSERMAIEVGVGIPGLTHWDTLRLETEIAKLPSFLPGFVSRQDGRALVLGTGAGKRFDPDSVARVLQGWTKALFGAHLVDVRMAFAPSHGRSALLVDMRARAQQYHAFRLGEQPN